MNRVKSVSGWCVAVMGGLLLALPAAAAGPKQKDPEQCKHECLRKATAGVDSCSQACPRGQDTAATAKCMTTCGEKYRAAEASCDSSCPMPKAPPPPPESQPQPQQKKK